ncbi:MAG: hypothetical protein ACREX7_02545 [Casimicrobiaceae bacterium]
MRDLRLKVAGACIAAIVVWGCGKEQPSTGAPDKASATSPRKVVEEKVPPYAYPAPVKGHIKEVNIGEFDLVDGIAYQAVGGNGTVVYVVSKPIASPLLVDSACPLTQARALAKLRNASFAEVTLDAAGRSRYFAAGTPFGGGLTDLAPRDWASALKADAGRATGSVTHRQYGRFEFDLTLSNPKLDEISEGDRQQKRRLTATATKPTPESITAAYVALRDAALKKNLKATLAALGFDAKQAAAIRGMDGIDADFLVFADRFLTPGTPGDPWNKPGSGQVRGEGVKASGKKFFNDYYFDLCGERLVLTGMVEQSP